MIRFALIGAGFIGTVHARNLAAHPGVSFDLIADADEARARTIAEKHSARVSSLDAVFDSDVDAIFVASSTNTHADFAERAAAAGKAILCEKPIDLNLERVQNACAKIKQAGVPFMISFNRRYDASHAAVHQAVQSGEIGKVEIIQIINRGPSVPPIEYVKVSGGQMRDQTIHFFDLLRWLTNDDPVELYTIGGALADKRVGEVGDVDTSLVTLRMASGALCQIDSARRTSYGYDERVEIFGSGGLAESQRQNYRNMSLYKGRNIISDGMYAGWFERIEATFYQALDAFVRHLNGEKVTVPSIEDGLKAQVIADTATESLKTGKPMKIQY